MKVDELITLMTEEGSDIVYNVNGYKCRAIRNDMGFWSGYVYIPNSQLNFDIGQIQAHGGITYQSQEIHDLVIGFDCGHGGDLIPFAYINGIKFPNNTYKDIKFVIAQFESITNQILNGLSAVRAAKLDTLTKNI